MNFRHPGFIPPVPPPSWVSGVGVLVGPAHDRHFPIKAKLGRAMSPPTPSMEEGCGSSCASSSRG